MINELKNICTASVARQLILGIALVHAILMSIFVFDLVGRQRDFMIEQSTSQVKGMAETLAANGSSWILSNDVVGIEEVIRSQSRFPGLDYAMFLDLNGKVLGYTHREKVGLYIKDPISQSLFDTSSTTQLLINNPSFIDAAAPVMIKNQQVGWARVGVNRHEIIHSLDLVTKKGLIYTLIAISLGVVFAWLMAKNLTFPLRRLTFAINQVIKGSRDVECIIDRQDEIGVLSQDFNLMLLSIKEQEKKVNLSHDALLKSEVKFHRLVEGLGSEYFLYSHDCDGVFTYATESVQSILGYSPEEFKIDCTSFFTLHPINVQARIHTENSIKGELQPSYEVEIYHKNGDKVWLNISEVPVFDDNGQVISVEGIARDVSQQKNFESILLAKEQEQSEILDNMLDGVLTLDDNGIILTCNHATEIIFGYQASQIKGKSFAMLLSASDLYSLIPDNRSNEEKADEDVFDLIGIRRQDNNEVFVDLNAEHKGGRKFPIRLSLAKLSLDKNGSQHYICSCSDRTEQKYQEEQLRRSQKMDALGKLTGGIAHDFNNMLGVILGYAELILLKAKNDSDMSKYVEQIQHAGNRGKKLTQKLLAFSRRKDVKSELVDLNVLLNDNYHMLAKSLTSKIELKYKLSEELWIVQFDKGDMEDVLINLCINAMHAMPDGGVLTIHTENVYLSEEQAKLHNLKAGNHVHISITDTGIGMDEQTRNQVFDPFFTTKDDIGTGLGLSQAYGFVQSSEGAINVYSELGHGTSFSLFFPQFKGEVADTLIEAEVKSKFSHGHGERILLVDDEPSLLLLGEEILSLHGYQIITADCAKSALEILKEMNKEEKISLLISDVIMPEMDGYQLSKIVSELYPDIKIQLSSGFSDDRHLQHQDDIFHKTILSKPYSSDELLKRVEELLE